LTITSGGISSNVVTALTGVDLTKFVVSGAQDFSVTNALTDSVSLATVDASGLTGLDTTFSLDASVSTKAMTVTLGAGVEGTAGGTVNTITTGYGADTVTGGEYKDVITTGAGADSVVAGAGNDVISTGLGNDNVDGGAGDDDISGSTGDDVLAGGDGNDTIDGGTGNDTLTGGAGNDKIYISALTDDVNVDGGAGTDTLSANSIATTGVATGDFVAVTEDAAPTIAGIETAYVSVTTSAANAAAADALVLDLTAVTDLTTLYLDVNSADNQYIKVNNFGGSSVVLTELDSGGTDGERVTIDGTGSNALTVTARGFNANAGAGEVVATGVSSLTVTGTSYISTSPQTNVLGAVTAANASSLAISTSGNSTASNANALKVASLSAANATSVSVTTGTNDTLIITSGITTANDLVSTLTVTLADDSTLTSGDIDLQTSAVQTATVTVGTGSTVSATDIEASVLTNLTATLGAASSTTLDLNTAVTAGTVTMTSGSSWTVDTIGAAGATTALTITGRGDLDASAAAGSTRISGTTVSFDASGLIDADGVSVNSAATVKATISGTSVADEISGGAGNDVLTGNAGADRFGLTGRVETITIASYDAADTVKFTANGVESEVITAGTGNTNAATVADDLADAINATSATSFVTATADTGVVTVTYAQYFGVAGATTLTVDGGTDMTAAVAIDTAGDNAGADTISGGTGADTIVAGSGADSINTGGNDGAVDVIIIASDAASAPATWTDTSGGSTVDVSSALRITAYATDTISLAASAGNFTAVNPATITQVTTAASIGNADDVDLYTGTYDSTTGLFTSTAQANATDLLMIYDNDVAGTAAYSMVVLIGGVTTTGIFQITESSGVLTLGTWA
jgi:hypothetical protein